MQRLESMLASVKAVNNEAYQKIGETLQLEFRDFVAYEASYHHMALVNVLPVTVHVAAVSVEQVYAAAMARPFQGVLLKGVLDDLEQGAAKKIKQTIAQGYVENKTTDQIIRELRGRTRCLALSGRPCYALARSRLSSFMAAMGSI